MSYRSKQSAAFAALMLAVALSGCANPDIFDSNERWFSRPFDFAGRNGGYTFSELKGASERNRPVNANDLVSPSGACPPPAPVVAAAPAAPAAAGPGAMPNAAPPAADAAPSLLGAPVALGMTECEVVDRAGAPSAVQIGANPNGDRTALLTYDGGPRPGIYHFERGRLMDMDRVAVATPEPKGMKRRPRVTRKRRKPEVSAAGPERISTQ